MTWDDMKFWDSGECQLLDEMLEDQRRKGIILCPSKENMYAALDAVALSDVRVAIIGQDPYPNPDLATGLSFSVPKSIKKFPPTLVNFLQEYSTDTHLPYPKNGDLTKWCKQGVLLWNAIPTCEAWRSLSHNGTEWMNCYGELQREVCDLMSAQDVVFILLGGYARDLKKYIDVDSKWVIETSHPSPRGIRFGKPPFLGSRVFTRANALLCQLGKPTINWSLQ